jgi:hypothetical protein
MEGGHAGSGGGATMLTEQKLRVHAMCLQGLFSCPENILINMLQ